jgi:hypothetical protein
MKSLEVLLVKINDMTRLIPPNHEIHLTPGDRFQILSVEAMHPRGWYPFLAGSKWYNDLGREFSIRQGSKLVLQKNGKRIAVFPIRIKEDFSNWTRNRDLTGTYPVPSFVAGIGRAGEFQSHKERSRKRRRKWSGIVIKMKGNRSPGGRLIAERIAAPTLPKRSRSLGRDPASRSG